MKSCIISMLIAISGIIYIIVTMTTTIISQNKRMTEMDDELVETHELVRVLHESECQVEGILMADTTGNETIKMLLRVADDSPLCEAGE